MNFAEVDVLSCLTLSVALGPFLPEPAWRWLRREAEETDKLAKDLRTYSDAALDEHVSSIREVFVRGRQTIESERRAFAAVREVARRVTGEEAYIVQLMGAMAL